MMSEYFAPFDLSFWGKMATWSLEEAACILAGFDPRELHQEGGNSISSLKQYQIYSLIQTQLKNHLDAGNLGQFSTTEKIKPAEVLKIADLLEYSVPQELKYTIAAFAIDTSEADKVTRLESHIQELETRLKKTPATGLSTKEKNSILLILYGMAQDAYGYDPKVRGNTVSDIKNALSQNGLSLNEDTIHKWLKVASEIASEKVS